MLKDCCIIYGPLYRRHHNKLSILCMYCTCIWLIHYMIMSIVLRSSVAVNLMFELCYSIVTKMWTFFLGKQTQKRKLKLWGHQRFLGEGSSITQWVPSYPNKNSFIPSSFPLKLGRYFVLNISVIYLNMKILAQLSLNDFYFPSFEPFSSDAELTGNHRVQMPSLCVSQAQCRQTCCHPTMCTSGWGHHRDFHTDHQDSRGWPSDRSPCMS